jgi:hypothetical protein
MVLRRVIVQECWNSEPENVKDDIKNEWAIKKRDFYAAQAKEQEAPASTNSEGSMETDEVGELIQ